MSEDKKVRAYSCADVIMLTAAYAQVENAAAYCQQIQQQRPKWDMAYYNALKIRIDNAIKTFIGRDNAKELREATQQVLHDMNNAMYKMGMFKVQVENDFKKEPSKRDELLNILGFNAFYAEANKTKKQAEILKLLQRFALNMTQDIKTDLVDKGMNGNLVDELVAAAAATAGSSLAQEVFKVQRPARSAEAVEEFNAIYSEVIYIITMARKVFIEDKTIYNTFSFAATVKAQTAFRKKKDKNIPPEENTPAEA